MKANEIIRNVLDLIDQVEGEESVQPEPIQGVVVEPGDDENRFKQILDLMKQHAGYSNSPNPAYGDLDSVTINAGGGWNGPKHPADIRVKDPSAYPTMQGQPCENNGHEQHAHLVMIKAMRGQ